MRSAFVLNSAFCVLIFPGVRVDKIAEIKQLYFQARPATIERDLARAIEILKSIESEEERERAAAFMDGLSELRAEWAGRRRRR